MKMKTGKIFCLLITIAILTTGCANKLPFMPSGTEEGKEIAGVTSQTPVTMEPEKEAVETEVPETLSPTPTPSKEPEPFTFNPHVHCDMISEVCPEETWESFYHLCDAIRAGEDSFECASEEAYKWCTDDVTLGSFMPAACTFVIGDGYENGVGKIKYEMDKDKFLEREKKFEEEICKMLNEAIRSDYSDFEKVMGLYAYVCQYFQYDFEPIDGMDNEQFGNYACLMHKNGICCEIAGSFNYLLLQSGVQSMPFGTDAEHDWNYVLVDGKGYHVDATWVLHGEFPNGPLDLQYFMQTEEERINDGFKKSDFQAEQIWYWKSDGDISGFTATDTKFAPLHDGSMYAGMDTERNVIKYTSPEGELLELDYSDLE